MVAGECDGADCASRCWRSWRRTSARRSTSPGRGGRRLARAVPRARDCLRRRTRSSGATRSRSSPVATRFWCPGIQQLGGRWRSSSSSRSSSGCDRARARRGTRGGYGAAERYLRTCPPFRKRPQRLRAAAARAAAAVPQRDLATCCSGRGCAAGSTDLRRAHSQRGCATPWPVVFLSFSAFPCPHHYSVAVGSSTPRCAHGRSIRSGL